MLVRRTFMTIGVLIVASASGMATTTKGTTLSRTGQTTSYATADDGALQIGIPSPTRRFTDNADGTVTDNLTGIVWLKNANCFGKRSWMGALTSANALATAVCGLTDGSSAGQWRLPNVSEMESLIDAEQYLPALSHGHPFTSVESDSSYWSSTTYVPSATVTTADDAWAVYVGDGSVASSRKSNSLYVWPIRDSR